MLEIGTLNHSSGYGSKLSIVFSILKNIFIWYFGQKYVRYVLNTKNNSYGDVCIVCMH